MLFFITQSSIYTSCNLSALCPMTQEAEGEIEKGLSFLSGINSPGSDYISDTVGGMRTIPIAEDTLEEVNTQPRFELDGCAIERDNPLDSLFSPIIAGRPSVGYRGMRALESPTSVIRQHASDQADATRLAKWLQSESCTVPSAEAYSEIAAKLAQPRPNVEIFFVERTGVLVDETISIMSPRAQNYEDTIEYLNGLAFLSESQAYITHWQLATQTTILATEYAGLPEPKGRV